MNQELGPNPDIIIGDTDDANTEFFAFESLGTVIVTDGDIEIRLDAVAGGGASDFVFADATAIRQISLIPEPSTLGLCIFGLAPLGFVRWRRRRR